jgi:hypothetical protein
VDDAELRTRIRALLASGALPGGLPDFPRVDPGAHATLIIRPGRGACAACGEADADVTYRYSDRDIALHRRCDEIWNEERQLL